MSSAELGAPIVSIVIPAHDYGRFLPITLASVRAQTLSAWECIIVDDGSTDDTLDVARGAAEADPRFHVVTRSPCRLGEARNEGIRMSSARYVQFLDADDLLEAHKLEHQADFLDQHSDVDVVYGDALYFESDGMVRTRRALRDDADWMSRVSGRHEQLLSGLIERNMMVVNAALVRRSALLAIDGFDTDLAALEDWDLWIRLAVRGARFEYRAAADTRALVRAHYSSMSRDLRRMLSATRSVRRNIARLVPEGPLYDRNRTLLHGTEARLAVLDGLNGDLASGLRRLLRAAAAARRPALLLWAAVLPLAAQSFMRPLVRRWRPELIAEPQVR